MESLPVFLYPKLRDFKHSDFRFLSHFQSLRRMEFVFCGLSTIELSWLSAAESVEILNVSNNRLKSLDGIEGMTNLRELHFGENQVESLDMIEPLEHLKGPQTDSLTLSLTESLSLSLCFFAFFEKSKVTVTGCWILKFSSFFAL